MVSIWRDVPRELNGDDFDQMNLPERFREASFRNMDRTITVEDLDSNGASTGRYFERESEPYNVVRNYLSNLRAMRERSFRS